MIINPKDKLGVKKAPFSTVPMGVVGELGLALFEGARKYGRHNYRVAPVSASVYYDACFRHMTDWWEGTDIDPDSGLSHVTKAIATLVVLRDSMMNDMMLDDRPPQLPADWQKNLNDLASEIIKKYPESVDPFTHKDKSSA